MNHIADDNLRSNIAQICADNADCNWDQLGTKIFIALGCKSKQLLEAESHTLERKDGENVNSYAMRLREIKIATALATRDGESFINSEVFETYLLTS